MRSIVERFLAFIALLSAPRYAMLMLGITNASLQKSMPIEANSKSSHCSAAC